jgi:dipeptidyl aminopeptidase/acylaminoacyl peptidase
LTESENAQFASAISPDGEVIVFHEQDPDGGWDLWTLAVDGEGEPEAFLRTEFKERNAAFSPDGRWLAYASDETGEMKVYVRPFPDSGGKWQVSVEHASHPEWSADGKRLYFRWDTALFVADVSAEAGRFRVGKPRTIGEDAVHGHLFFKPYSVAADESRIITMAATDARDEKPNYQTLVVNWFDELRRRAPRGR